MCNSLNVAANKRINLCFAHLFIIRSIKVRLCTIVHALYVFLEYSWVPEVLATLTAVKLLHAGMNLVMPREHGQTREPLLTDSALKRTLVTVRHLQRTILT